MVQVLVYNKKGRLKDTFNSLKDCALHFGISGCHLCNYHLNNNIPKNGLFFKRGKNNIQYTAYTSKSHYKKFIYN